MKPSDIMALEESLGYHFQRQELIEQALTHSSQAREIEALATGDHPVRRGYLRALQSCSILRSTLQRCDAGGGTFQQELWIIWITHCRLANENHCAGLLRWLAVWRFFRWRISSSWNRSY